MSVSMSLSLPPLCDHQIETLFHSQSTQKGRTTFSWEREKKILYPTKHLNIDKQGCGKILLCDESHVHASEVSEGKIISTN